MSARVALVALLATGCHGSTERSPSRPPSPAPTLPTTPTPTTTPTTPTTTPSAPLPGRLEVPASVRSSDELTAHLTITNAGTDDLSLPKGALELGLLALEVRDATGARVPTVPPRTPRTDDAQPVVIEPGESLARDYQLAVFSPPLAPGRYTVACRIVACAPVPFVVAP